MYQTFEAQSQVEDHELESRPRHNYDEFTANDCSLLKSFAFKGGSLEKVVTAIFDHQCLSVVQRHLFLDWLETFGSAWNIGFGNSSPAYSVLGCIFPQLVPALVT